MTAQPSIAFDVDDTLIRQTRDGLDVPRYPVIQILLLLKSLGCQIYIWSGGGVEYAMRWVEKLGLDDVTVVQKGSFKPDIAFDDMAHQWETGLATVNIKV